MKNRLLLLILILFAASCSAPLNFQLSKIGAEPEEYQQRIIYSLPKTVLRIDIEIEKETYVPGPYKLYAKRLLGLDNVIQDYAFQYKINSVDLKSFTESDPELFFSVNVIKGSMLWDKYLSLTERGFIFLPGESGFLPLISEKNKMDNSGTSFQELSMKTNLTEIKDTLYKTIVSDTALIRLPVVTTSQQVKTLEQKAMEAAKNFFLIRENRFYTITNIEGDYPDGKAMEIMVKEMDKMEKAYFDLFAGRVVKQKFTRSFIFTPDPTEEDQTFKICSFSTAKGLSDKNDGYDINLELIPMNNVPQIPELSLESEPSEMNINKLIYRIPDIASIRIKLMNELLYENRIGIYQFGSLMDIPVTSTSHNKLK